MFLICPEITVRSFWRFPDQDLHEPSNFSTFVSNEKTRRVTGRSSNAPWSQKRFGLIIIIVVVPMTVMAPVPVPVRIIVVIILAIVMRIIAPVVYGIRGAISGFDRYTKVTVSLRFLRHESHEPKR